MRYLEIKNLRKSFGDLTVIEDISLTVDEGQVVAIIGPSGSGKSTLLRCATMLETMDSGELIYLGEHAVKNNAEGKAVYAPLKQLKKIQRYYSLVFQDFNLFPHFSVIKNVTDARLLFKDEQTRGPGHRADLLQNVYPTRKTPTPTSSPGAAAAVSIARAWP